jgi:hypothetical protein
VHHVLSNDHNRGGPFNKGRMIQRGFDQLGGHDWILHLDGDIVLPRKFRQYLDWAHLDERVIYGADRCNLVGFDEWNRLKQYAGAWDNHAHECGHWFHPKFQVGSRWVSKLHGYVPIGFFQLFHGGEMVQGGYHQKIYPYHHGDAARSDVQFALQWDRRFREVVPEVIVLHLESETSGLGANWKGRTTPRFGPPSSGAAHRRPEPPRPVRPPHPEPPHHEPPHRRPPSPVEPPPHHRPVPPPEPPPHHPPS